MQYLPWNSQAILSFENVKQINFRYDVDIYKG